MKKFRFQNREYGGFTVPEVLIAMAVAGVVGAAVYLGLIAGLVLFSKNIALNTAHQQARSSILRMQRNLHSAVSIPYLIDSSLTQGSSSASLGGIAFQTYALGPWKVAANATSSSTVIRVQFPSGAKMPVVGQKLIVPTHEIEQWVKTVTPVSSTQADITLYAALGSDVTVQSGGNNYNVVCFITDIVGYLVYNGTLIYFPNLTSWNFQTLATGVTSLAPFSTPQTPLGAPFNRFVAAIDLTTADMSSTNRIYKESNIFLHSEIPFRARLTTYQ
jgi:prepilin-type N-terminal cleavage/methylation domain-containing protein